MTYPRNRKSSGPRVTKYRYDPLPATTASEFAESVPDAIADRMNPAEFADYVDRAVANLAKTKRYRNERNGETLYITPARISRTVQDFGGPVKTEQAQGCTLQVTDKQGNKGPSWTCLRAGADVEIGVFMRRRKVTDYSK